MKNKHIIIILFAFVLLFSSLKIDASEKAHELKQGDYVQMGVYNDEPVMWRVMGNNEYGTYLITDKVISFKPFSGRGAVDGRDKAIWSKTVYDGATDRGLWGDPRWEYSSLRVWLNSSDKDVNYYGVIEPSSENLRNTTVYPKDGGRYKIVTNAYDKEEGFLYEFNPVERNAIATVTHKVLLNDFDKEDAAGGDTNHTFSLIYKDLDKLYDRCYYKMTTEKVFCPSIKELRDFFFISGVSIQAKPTLQAYEREESKENNRFGPNDYVRYWLRTPELLGDSISRVKSVFNTSQNGYDILGLNPAQCVNESKTSLYNQAVGVRPALYLKKDVGLSGKGTLEKPYTLLFKETTYGPSNWAKSDVESAIKHNLTTEQVTINYQNYITREEFCEVVMKLYDALGGKTISNTSNPFTDTNNKEVIRAYQAKIVSGTSKTRFSPNSNLTREQLCVMIIGALDAVGVDYSSSMNYQKNYSDIDDLSSWSKSAVRVLNGYKIFNGTNKGLEPRGTVTKEVAIVLLERTFNKFK